MLYIYRKVSRLTVTFAKFASFLKYQNKFFHLFLEQSMAQQQHHRNWDLATNYVHDLSPILQAQTMEMMYKIIADELKAMDIKDLHPQDYLNFFCLGNREEPTSNGSLESEKSSDKSAAVIYCCTSFLILQTKKKCRSCRYKNLSNLFSFFHYLLMCILIG